MRGRDDPRDHLHRPDVGREPGEPEEEQVPQRRVALVAAVAIDQVAEAVSDARQAPGVDLITPHLVVHLHEDQEQQIQRRDGARETPVGLLLLHRRPPEAGQALPHHW